MLQSRVIPVLLLQGKGLVKTVKFENPKYIGDPINAVRIFNDKEADELVFFDIEASEQGKQPDFELIKSIASECFMPLGYGGGIRNLEDISRLFAIGVEKVIINSSALNNMKLISDAASVFGNQSIVLSVDVQKNFWGKYQVFSHAKIKHPNSDVIAYVKEGEKAGVGEIILNSLDKDGTMQGYDLVLIQKVSEVTNIPVVACGGAGSLSHFQQAVGAGASGVAAGSFFVYHGPHKAVLINYPTQPQLKTLFQS